MNLSFGTGPAKDIGEGVSIIRYAVEGRVYVRYRSAYGPYTNEKLVGEALAPDRDRVVIATKFGLKLKTVRSPARTAVQKASGRSPRLRSRVCGRT